ncbi:hypothetical protein SOVF_205170 [Spinacia oleracea]|nr:hypothetical protein SOVF_205170 [Spinacia oleracea]
MDDVYNPETPMDDLYDPMVVVREPPIQSLVAYY